MNMWGKMSDIEESIKQSLQEIEASHHVRILYACESGSRAWGFESQDSDYDVRFLYVRPQSAYLMLDAPRDVIELPIAGDLDINGWDIFKALRLFRKSNPPLLEWLFSPIVYQESSSAIQALREIAQRRYSTPALFYHYLHMARTNHRQYLLGKSEVILKKYLYAIRPLIVLLFLEQQQRLPSTNFLATLAQVRLPEAVRAHILMLIERKLQGTELGAAPPDEVLDAFIATRLEEWQSRLSSAGDTLKDSQELEPLLQRILAQMD
jgi:predicted nucleotidyltransferase